MNIRDLAALALALLLYPLFAVVNFVKKLFKKGDN